MRHSLNRRSGFGRESLTEDVNQTVTVGAGVDAAAAGGLQVFTNNRVI